MKSSLIQTVRTLAAMAGCLVAGSGIAATVPFGNYHLAADTFLLNTPVEVDPVANPHMQTRQAGDAIFQTFPESRKVDEFMDPTSLSNLERRWMGSNDFILSQRSGNDGQVIRNTDPQSMSNSLPAVAYIADSRNENPESPFWVQADVFPGDPVLVNGVATVTDFDGRRPHSSIGMIDDAANYGSEDLHFASGFGELWLDINRGGHWTLSGAGNKIIADPMIMGSGMEMAADLLNNDANPNNDWDFMGYNTLFLSWDPETNTATVKINGETFVDAIPMIEAGTGLPIDFDPTGGVSNVPDIYGFGFQFQHGALDNYAAIPEPSSMLMMCFGMLFFGLNNRRQRRRARKLGFVGSSLTG